MPDHLLYSFRRCPYAIRARLGLAHSGVDALVREVQLSDKPKAMLAASSKATVPILLVESDPEHVIDQSIEIMRWAVTRAEKSMDVDELRHELIVENDDEFKQNLDRYKYFDRYPEHSQDYYWQRLKPFLNKLQRNLVAGATAPQLLDGKASLIDWAIFPFVRQCFYVDQTRFLDSGLDQLLDWLHSHLNHPVFVQQMHKHPFWRDDNDNPYHLLEGAQ